METPLPDNPSPSQSESSLGRCPACGYIVHGLPEPRCPECGEKFDPKLLVDDEVRAHLLAWERPELGGRPRRFVKTVFAACFKPWSHFDHARQRIDTPISHAGQFIRWCLIVAVLCHVVGSVAEKAIFFGRNILGGSTVERSWSTMIESSKLAWASDIAIAAYMLLSTVLFLSLLSLLLLMITEGRGIVIRHPDVVALVCPATVLAETSIVLSLVLSRAWPELYMAPTLILLVFRPVIFAVFGVCCCRKFLLLRWTQFVGAVILFVIVAMLAERLVYSGVMRIVS